MPARASKVPINKCTPISWEKASYWKEFGLAGSLQRLLGNCYGDFSDWTKRSGISQYFLLGPMVTRKWPLGTFRIEGNAEGEIMEDTYGPQGFQNSFSTRISTWSRNRINIMPDWLIAKLLLGALFLLRERTSVLTSWRTLRMRTHTGVHATNLCGITPVVFSFVFLRYPHRCYTFWCVP